MMKKFEKPEYVITALDEERNYAKFVIEPLERGFGTTLGNSLRRVLLSSLPGASIYGVEIEGVRHEFSTVKGVEEDVTAIVLNLKDLVLEINDEIVDEGKKLILEVKGPAIVTGKDIQCPTGVEVISKDLHIATVAEGGELKATLYAKNGRGFVTAEENKSKRVSAVGFIPTDSKYSPIVKISYEIEGTRVGSDASYERLIFEITTNGGMSPQVAIAFAAKILMDHYEPFAKLSTKAVLTETMAEPIEEKEPKIPNQTIEDLDLTVRSYNCLKRAGIQTVEELTQKTEEEMMKIRNLGKKSLKEVKDVLQSFGFSFKTEDY